MAKHKQDPSRFIAVGSMSKYEAKRLKDRKAPIYTTYVAPAKAITPAKPTAALRPYVLVVDDKLFRRDRFYTQIGKHVDMEYAETPLDAIKMIRTREFDAIFLDFNLHADDMDGRDVAAAFWLSCNIDTPVFIHSLDSGGADIMASIFRVLDVAHERHCFSDYGTFWDAVFKFLNIEKEPKHASTPTQVAVYDGAYRDIDIP